MNAQEIIVDLLSGADYVLGEVAADMQAHYPNMSWADAVVLTRKEIANLVGQGKAKVYRELSFKPRKTEPIDPSDVERLMADDERWVSSNEYWVGRL